MIPETEEPDDIDMQHVHGSVYVRAMVEIINPEPVAGSNLWPTQDSARWPIPFSVHELIK